MLHRMQGFTIDQNEHLHPVTVQIKDLKTEEVVDIKW